MSWKPWAGSALIVGYAVTVLAGVPATRQSFLEAWVDHRIEVAIRDGHAPIPSDELDDLRYAAGDIVRVERVVPIFPCVLMVEYAENHRHRSSSGRALTFWLPGTVRVIVDAV